MEKLSIILPIYNEAGNIGILYIRLKEIISNIPNICYEIIFVDDGSKDESWLLIKELGQYDSCVKGITFSRNFGQQAALTAAYEYASGDVIISMDADMQDPPETIFDMVDQWRKGFDIVYARRINREDSWLKTWTAWIYSRILEAVSDVKIPADVGDFRLLDRKVVNALLSCSERNLYWRGIVAWVGFKSTFVHFKRPLRHSGKTGYTWKKLIKIAVDGVTSFSLFPLKIAAFVGSFVILTGILMFLYVTYDSLFRNVFYPLFKWLVIIIYIFMGIQMLLLWLIGEYIGRIYEQQKGRPRYLIAHQINFDQQLNKNEEKCKKNISYKYKNIKLIKSKMSILYK